MHQNGLLLRVKMLIGILLLIHSCISSYMTLAGEGGVHFLPLYILLGRLM